MRLIINFTCFIDNEIYEDKEKLQAYMEYLFYNYSEQIEKHLGYTIIKKTIGLHEQSSRPHFHLFILFDVGKGKVYKVLNDKIRKYQNLAPVKVYLLQKINVSFLYEGQTKKSRGSIIPYDETALRYPFKEGNSYYNYDGFQEEEIKILRNTAMNEWAQAQAIRQNKQKKQELNEADKKNVEIYIKDGIEEIGKEDFKLTYSLKDKIKKVMGMIIEYNVENGSHFNISQLKNKSINILRFLECITTDEIVDLIYI